MAVTFNNNCGSSYHLENEVMMLKETIRQLRHEQSVQKMPPRAFTEAVVQDGRRLRITRDPFGSIVGVEDDVPRHSCERESHLNKFRKTYINFLRKANPGHPLFSQERRESRMFEGRRVCCAYHIIRRELGKS